MDTKELAELVEKLKREDEKVKKLICKYLAEEEEYDEHEYIVTEDHVNREFDYYTSDDNNKEYCPVCYRLNLPGDANECEHFIGSTYDGHDIIWSDLYDKFRERFSLLCGLLEEYGSVNADIVEKFYSDSKNSDLTIYISNCRDSASNSVYDIFFELHQIIIGKYRETGGMLSSFGESLYMNDKNEITETIKIYEELIERFNKHTKNSSIISRH